MINKNRIVPITTIDLLSMYGVILHVGGVNVAALEADNVLGEYTITAAGSYLADQPVKSMDITSSTATVYFVAGYDYEGFKLNGTAVTPTIPTEGLMPDGRTLYKAVLASGAVTITKVGF